jgi:hypothetical protein
LGRCLAYARTLRAARILVVGTIAPEIDFIHVGDRCATVEYMPAATLGEMAAVLAAVAAARIRGEKDPVTVVLPAPAPTPWASFSQWRLRARLLRREGVAVAQVAPGLDTAGVATRHTSLISIASLNAAALTALNYCGSLLRGRVLGVHVVADEDQEQARRDWDAWGNHFPLINIDSPYRAIVAPLRAYIDALSERGDGETITLVLPLVFAPGLLSRILHNHTANRLRGLLLKRPNTVVISIPHRIP